MAQTEREALDRALDARLRSAAAGFAKGALHTILEASRFWDSVTYLDRSPGTCFQAERTLLARGVAWRLMSLAAAADWVDFYPLQSGMLRATIPIDDLHTSVLLICAARGTCELLVLEPAHVERGVVS